MRAVRIHWIAALVALHVFAFRHDDAQMAAIRSVTGAVLYVVAMIGVAAIGSAYRRSHRGLGVLEFDAPAPEAAATLNLSQATG